MCGYKVNQHLIVLKLDSVSVNKIVVMEFVIVSESEFDIKYVNTVTSNTKWVRVFKSN